MPRNFKKLDNDLAFSSINEEPLHIKWAFVILMTLANWKTGEFRVTPKKLALLCGEGMTEEMAREALKVLTEPDPQSSSPELDGRRLEHLGSNDYRFVNWALYQGDIASIYEAERKKEAYWRRKQEEMEKAGEGRRKAEKAGGPSISTSSSTSSSRSKTRKKASERVDYSDSFEAFWEQTWKRGHKKAAFGAWEAIDADDLNAVVVAAANWTKAFERRPADKRPHVSTWLNNRGWEDDLAAELAGAKGDERQVGKHVEEAPDEEAAKKRRNKVRQAILEHAMHLMELKVDDPDAALVVQGAISDLKKLHKLECESDDARELIEGFEQITDAMLLDLAGVIIPKTDRRSVFSGAMKIAVSDDVAVRKSNAMLRSMVCEELKIKRITDYDWRG